MNWKNMRQHSSFPEVFIPVLMLLLSISGQAQPLANRTTFDFIDEAENVLRNDVALESFLHQLHTLDASDSGTVSVVHIGDSHIQADFLTEVVRRNLQAVFGNAGRGLVVPGRVAGTNEPFNIRTSAVGSWASKRIIHPSNPMPIGIGGITVSTQEEKGTLAVTIKDGEVDYRFNRLTLFMPNDTRSYSIALMDSLSVELARYTPTPAKEGSFDVKMFLPGLYRHIELRNIRESEGQSHTTLFGMSFENGNAGILYHAIGVNGARFEHYNKAELFSRQTSLLKPNLVIISLGTNESVEYPGLKSDFLQQVHSLVSTLRKNNPDAAFLLVTPPDAFLKKVKPNPGIEIIRRQILDYAVENGIAFWDMHKIGGGVGSAIHWKAKGLLRPDGIHFTREGYVLQGRLLFEAIMKSYTSYVANRYP
jgi:lysophospholipase L1-like esterase